MPLQQGQSLWGRYNSLLLSEHKRHTFPLLCFDEEEKLLQIKMDQVVQQLGLDSKPAGAGFYSSELRSPGDTAVARLPWKIARIYRALVKRSL